MMHVKPSAMSVSQVMTWENAVCSPHYWVLAKKIKLTEGLLINTLVEPPLPALYPPVNPSLTQPPEMAPQIKSHPVPPILQFYCLNLKSYNVLHAFASSHLLSHQSELLKLNIPVWFPNSLTLSHLFPSLCMQSSLHPTPALFSSGLFDPLLLIHKNHPEVAFFDLDLPVHLGWGRDLLCDAGISLLALSLYIVTAL